MNAPQAFEIKEDIAHYIGGQMVLPQGSRFADVYNPATGSISRRVALASKADVNQAVAAADAAFPAWANTSPLRRARIGAMKGWKVWTKPCTLVSITCAKTGISSA